MYQLHIANKNYSSWSLRPWILMKELSIPFTEIMHPFGGESFLLFSPTGKVPCLASSETRVWDSLAITEYLAEKHSNIWPSDTVARAWARSAAAEMHSGFTALRNICGMNVGLEVKLHNIPDSLKQDLERIEALWLDGLTKFGGPFLAGKTFTAIDAFFAPVVFRIKTYHLPLKPELLSYYKFMLSLKGMQEWESAALSEVWRDSAHEQDVLLHGTILKDNRVN